MSKRKIRKTLISPKVRLLLWIYMHEVKDESNWLAKLADKIDYSEGSIKSHLADFLDNKLIESLNSVSPMDPPYRITDEGKRFLQPILFVTKIGMAISIWVGLWAVVYYLYFINQPILMIASWLPLLIAGFVILALVLLFYPYLLLKFGKISY